MTEMGKALKQYRELKKFKNEKHAMVPDERMIMLNNDECGTVPLKEGQAIKLLVSGIIGKPKKEGYPIRIDYAEMDEDDKKPEKLDRPVVSPSA